MNKITQAMVARVKRENKKLLHPKSWHDFMNLPEVKSINFAIFAVNLIDNREIAIEAKSYYADIYAHED
jgi:hypothetical protein